MDTSALILGLAGGGTIGAVLTTLLRHSHERDERHRERALAAATDFLGAYDRAAVAILDVQGKARVARNAALASKARRDSFIEASKDLVAIARDLPGRDSSDDDGGNTPLGSATRALYAVSEISKAQEIEADELVVVNEAVSLIEAALPRLTDLPPPFRVFGKRLREVMSDLRLMLKTNDALEASMRASVEASNAFEARRPIIRVLFASDADDVVRVAAKCVDDVAAANEAACFDAMTARDGFDNAEVNRLLSSARDTANDFADAVSRRLRPSRRSYRFVAR